MLLPAHDTSDWKKLYSQAKQREDLSEPDSQKPPQTAYGFWGVFALTGPPGHFVQTQKQTRCQSCTHQMKPAIKYTPQKTPGTVYHSS